MEILAESKDEHINLRVIEILKNVIIEAERKVQEMLVLTALFSKESS
jgi:hypothetical protein